MICKTIKVSLLSLVTGVMVTSCGDSDSSDDAATATATDVEVSTGTALNVGALALGSIDAGSLGVGSATSDLLLQEESEPVSDRDSNCSVYGSPVDANGDRLNAGDDGYAQAAIYCAVVYNTGSPDSVLGAIAIPGVLTCELERAGAWESDADFTEAGNNVGQVTVTLSTNCADAWIVERLSDGGDGVYPLQDVTLTDLPDTHGYDKKISLNMGDGTEDFYIRASDNYIAARAESWAFSVDLIDNIVRYETLGESTSSESNESYVRRIRLRVEGEIGETGAFESISQVDAIKLEGRGISEGWSDFVTLSGVPDTGLATSLYYEHPDNGFTSDETGCTSSDCSAATRITATEAAIDLFHSNAQVDYLAHDEEEGILDFDTVDLSGNVTYSTNR